MRKFSLLQILGIVIGLFAFIFIVNGLLSLDWTSPSSGSASYLPLVSPEIESCIAREKNRTGSDSQGRIIVQFYPVESNIEKANALLRDLGFVNTLGAVPGKTDEVWIRVVRDEQNILEEFFQAVDSVDYQNFIKGHLGLIKPDLYHEVTDRIREADLGIVKQIEGDNADIGGLATPRQSYKSGTSFVQEYIIRLGSHISREEVDSRFGGYDMVRIDDYETFYLDPIDFMVFISVEKGQEAGWVCYLNTEYGDLLRLRAHIDIPVEPL